MLRRLGVVRARLLAGMCAAGWLFAASAAAVNLTLTPYLQDMTPTAVTICWETSTAVVGVVAYGPGTTLTNRLAERRATAHHEVRIEGLQPATQYVYRVEGMPAGQGIPFRTAPPPGTASFRLAVYGDSRSNPTGHHGIAELILQHRPDLVLHTGDFVGRGSETRLWKPEFFDPARNLIAQVPLWPCLGNHEGESANYYRFFALPGRESWYSFDWGDAHFISLDSCLPGAPGTEQYEWLVRDLATTRAPWKIAFLHHPPFSVHPTRAVSATREHWSPLFRKYGVQLVFNGHDHQYARTHRIDASGNPDARGTVYIVAGGGGAPLYPVTDKPYSAVAKSVHNFVVLDFAAGAVRGEAYDDRNEVIDSFEVML